MNEAETKIVQQYIEMMEDDWHEIKRCYKERPRSHEWIFRNAQHYQIMKSHEYEALKALVENCSMCYQREGEFEGIICPRCGKSNDIVEAKPSRTIKSSGTTGKVSIKAVREAVKAIKDKPDAEGWIKWEGGEQPLYSCDFVEVKLQDGRTLKSRTNCFYWADVIAYRIVEEPKKPKKQTFLQYLESCLGDPNCHDGDTYTHSYRCDKHQYKPASSSVDKPSAEGWIKWETPGMDEEVELKHKDGEIKKLKANVVNWHNSNIIAYRIVEDPKKPKKQTLLEFFYEGQETCGVVERNLISKISEWAELYLENKED